MCVLVDQCPLSSLPDESGWGGPQCTGVDHGLLAHSVYHCTLCRPSRGTRYLRHLPQVLLEAVQWTTADTPDTHGNHKPLPFYCVYMTCMYICILSVHKAELFIIYCFVHVSCVFCELVYISSE